MPTIEQLRGIARKCAFPDASNLEWAAQTLRENPVIFTMAYWELKLLWDRHPLTWIEIDAIRYIHGLDEPSASVRILMGTRGWGKTTFGTKPRVLYRLCQNPNDLIILRSKSSSMAETMLSDIRHDMELCWFTRHLIPRKDQLDNSSELEVGCVRKLPHPSITAMGVATQISGRRVNETIDDDCEDDNALSATREFRDNLERQMRGMAALFYMDKTRREGELPARHIIIGTAKHDDDSVYLRLARSSTSDAPIAVRSYPVQAPQQDEKVYQMAPAIRVRMHEGRIQPGQPLVPAVFDTKGIAQKRAGFGTIAFNREFMCILESGSQRGNPLRLRDLIVMDVPRDTCPASVMYGTVNNRGSTEYAGVQIVAGREGDNLYGPALFDTALIPYARTVAAIDPSGSRDKTGLSILSEAAGMFWLKHCDGLDGDRKAIADGSHSDLNSYFDEIARRLRKHGATLCFYEQNAVAISETWRRAVEEAIVRHSVPKGHPNFPSGWSCSLTPIHSVTQKEKRIIATLEPLFTSHRLVVDPSCLRARPDQKTHETLQYQITRITEERKCLQEDGMIDSLAMAVTGCQSVSSVLRTSPVRSVAASKAQEAEKRLQEGIKSLKRSIAFSI